MQRLVLLVVAVAALAGGCATGDATTTTAPGAERALDTPDPTSEPADPAETSSSADAGATVTTSAPPTTTTLVSPPYDANDQLGVDGGCGSFFDDLVDASFWDREPDEVEFAIAWFDQLGADGTELLGRMEAAAAAEPFDGVALASVYADLDTHGLDACGEPAGGLFFVTLGAAARVSKFCAIDTSLEDVDPADCQTSEPVHPDSFPCLVATGVSWETFGQTEQQVPWVPVDCTTGDDVFWDSQAAAWLPRPSFQLVPGEIGE
ncbi:MAG: hypothetical protein AAGA90_02475 [Actinomycetota bacterium]